MLFGCADALEEKGLTSKGLGIGIDQQAGVGVFYAVQDYELRLV